jgi:NAD(P)-dependent dehydrogenase (short-subunit alcohol dehydrogenase family)
MLVVGLSRRPSGADEHEECDVSERAAVEEVAARVLERHPRIDLLVNNAGVAAGGSFLTVEPERIEQTIRVNYLGSVWATLAFLPGLGEGSHVVNLVSVAGTVANGPYSASKHAQLAFSRATAAQLRGRGIRVHTVKPGFVETESFPQSGLPRPLRRLVIGPEKIADHVVTSIERGHGETTVPRYYAVASVLQALAPNVLARILARSAKPS